MLHVAMSDLRKASSTCRANLLLVGFARRLSEPRAKVFLDALPHNLPVSNRIIGKKSTRHVQSTGTTVLSERPASTLHYISASDMNRHRLDVVQISTSQNPADD